jgi:DNA-binding NarL/FixJ family response regulator
MNMLPRLSTTKPYFSDAISWILTSGIPLRVGIISSRRLLLFAVYHLIPRKQAIEFLATDIISALDEIQNKQPALLIVTPDLEQGGCGITLLNRAHQLQSNLRSILIIDPIRDDIKYAYQSSATAVIAESEIFAAGDHQDDLIVTLARDKTYRSPLLRASWATHKGLPNSSEASSKLPFNITARERNVAELLMQGYTEKMAAKQLGIGYNTVRSHAQSLRRKLGVSNRNQLLVKLFACGMQKSGQMP